MLAVATSTLIVAGLIVLVLALTSFAGDPKIFAPVDTQLVLDSTGQTKTATFSGAALDLGANYAPGAGGTFFQAAIDVSTADFTSGDETYTFKLQESADNSTWTDCSAAISVVSAGVPGFVTVGAPVQKRYLRYTLTIGGTTPTITYGKIYAVPAAGRN